MEHTLVCPKTFRYFTHGNPEKATTILYVLHGYGQLAEYFIRKFHGFDENYFIVAPEGMHRFYLNGTSGRVGASWMTKEARQQDIHDTQNWLKSLESELDEKYCFDNKIILGFSQGGATAARWNAIKNNKNVIYWASVFPPDIEMNEQIEIESIPQNYFVLGKKDEYFTPEQQNKTINFYKEKGFKITQYEGNHSVDLDVLKEILTDILKSK